MKFIFLTILLFNIFLATVQGEESIKQKRGIFSRNRQPMDVRRREQQVLPPIALPGIMNDYDPARIYHRGKRMFVSELNLLEKRFPYMDDILSGNENVMSYLNSRDRKKRSILEGEKMIYVPHPLVHRRKRDLRRLKRDLAYATGHGYPNFAINKRNRNLGEVAYPEYVPPQEDIESLMQGLDMLEYLALLKQANEVPSLGSTDNYYNMHSSASRFAPQPRLFPEESMRKEDMGQMWANRHVPQGRIVWSPEKRSSIGHLSMVPGFKRSAFREAERMVPKSSHTNPKSVSLDKLFGKESNNMQIRRVAM